MATSRGCTVGAVVLLLVSCTYARNLLDEAAAATPGGTQQFSLITGGSPADHSHMLTGMMKAQSEQIYAKSQEEGANTDFLTALYQLATMAEHVQSVVAGVATGDATSFATLIPNVTTPSTLLLPANLTHPDYLAPFVQLLAADPIGETILPATKVNALNAITPSIWNFTDPVLGGPAITANTHPSAGQFVQTSFVGLSYKPCLVQDNLRGVNVNPNLINISPGLIQVSPSGILVNPQLIAVVPILIKVNPYGINYQPIGINVQPILIAVSPKFAINP